MNSVYDSLLESRNKSRRKAFSDRGLLISEYTTNITPIINDLETLKGNEYKVTYFTEITAATGTINIPQGATILLDQFSGGVDAYVSTLDTGQPTGDFPTTGGGALVDVQSFDASGNYTLTGTPSNYPVAFIYVLKISAIDYSVLNLDNILSVKPIANIFLGLNEVAFGNSVTGQITSNPYIRTYENLGGFSNRTGIQAGGIVIWNPGGVGAIRSDYSLGITCDWDMLLTSLSPSTYPVNLNNGLLCYSNKTLIYTGGVATDLGLRIDTVGVKIGPYSTLGTTNTNLFEVQDASGNTALRYTPNGVQPLFRIENPGNGYSISMGWASSVGGNAYLQTNANVGFYILTGSTIYFKGDGYVYANGYYRWEALAGTNSRMYEVDAEGDASATAVIRDAIIVDTATIDLLTDEANWTGTEYTGTAITGTYEGQKYNDDKYKFDCVSDNNWIRGDLSVKRVIYHGGHANTSYADSTTYYSGLNNLVAASTTSGNRNFKFLKVGSVKKFSIDFHTGTAATNENVTVYLRNISQSTETLLDTITLDGTAGVFNGFISDDLDILINTSDNYSIKIVTPAFSTNPVDVSCTYNIYVE